MALKSTRFLACTCWMGQQLRTVSHLTPNTLLFALSQMAGQQEGQAEKLLKPGLVTVARRMLQAPGSTSFVHFLHPQCKHSQICQSSCRHSAGLDHSAVYDTQAACLSSHGTYRGICLHSTEGCQACFSQGVRPIFGATKQLMHQRKLPLTHEGQLCSSRHPGWCRLHVVQELKHCDASAAPQSPGNKHQSTRPQHTQA